MSRTYRKVYRNPRSYVHPMLEIIVTLILQITNTHNIHAAILKHS
jgi:hypothetical protein